MIYVHFGIEKSHSAAQFQKNIAHGYIDAGADFVVGTHPHVLQGIPVYDEDGNLERYNIFSTRMLVRCDVDGKLYLYDLVRTKKETSKPHEQ